MEKSQRKRGRKPKKETIVRHKEGEDLEEVRPPNSESKSRSSTKAKAFAETEANSSGPAEPGPSTAYASASSSPSATPNPEPPKLSSPSVTPNPEPPKLSSPSITRMEPPKPPVPSKPSKASRNLNKPPSRRVRTFSRHFHIFTPFSAFRNFGAIFTFSRHFLPFEILAPFSLHKWLEQSKLRFII